MRLLPCGIGSGQNAARLAQPKPQLAEQTLALPNSEFHSVGFFDPSRQGFAIPQVDSHTRVARLASQHAVDLLDLLLAQTTGPTRPRFLHQSAQPLLFQPMHPILHRTCRVTQQSRHLRAPHALRHQQHAVQAVVVTRLFGPMNLLLQTQHGQSIRYPVVS